jgi:hypothetical protein
VKELVICGIIATLKKPARAHRFAHQRSGQGWRDARRSHRGVRVVWTLGRTLAGRALEAWRRRSHQILGVFQPLNKE